ncbi:MAG: DNA (cytosine-5-)-methyltransferase [Cyclobacteriaceae bacterium]
MPIPIIDLFAGPGGLGEGFSSLLDKKDDRIFDIKLSIEKDLNAHETLRLRSFYRKFPVGQAPEAYYEILRAKTWKKRKELIDKLKDRFNEEWQTADKEAWCFELPYPEEFDKKGSKKGGYTPAQILERNKLIDVRIEEQLDGQTEFVLIGGPPCQAYSLAGRSRNQWTEGLDKNDHRVDLYKQYLRIIAKHQPSVFVMENVKGLLSAKVEEEKVFPWILRDLKNPSSVFKEYNSSGYKIYSLSTAPVKCDESGNPQYSAARDYLIRAEDFGIPQARHRVILLGIRDDIDVCPLPLIKEESVGLKEIIGDLPKIRSGLSKKYLFSKTVYKDGEEKEKRYYEPIKDSPEKWFETVSGFRNEIGSWNGLEISPKEEVPRDIGGEFIKFNTPKNSNPLYEWYNDDRLEGVLNHESRSHLYQDIFRYQFLSIYSDIYDRFPRLEEFKDYHDDLVPNHKNADSGKFSDRFRVQLGDYPATTITSHISKDGHYFIHYDPIQCRSLTVREGARIQTFPDNYLFCGTRTQQYHQVGNAVPPFVAYQIADIVSKII